MAEERTTPGAQQAQLTYRYTPAPAQAATAGLDDDSESLRIAPTRMAQAAAPRVQADSAFDELAPVTLIPSPDPTTGIVSKKAAAGTRGVNWTKAELEVIFSEPPSFQTRC